jgi:transposase
LEQVRPRIEALLAEWKTQTASKQRITATAVHAQLVAEGYSVGTTTVRSYIRELKRRSQEVFVPLEWRPGDAAQVDFFEVSIIVAGERRKAWMFLMRLVYSGHDFVALYDRCDQISFLDGHVRAFEYFGAVPQRVIYDNLKPAVKKVLPDRELSVRFVALAKHYLFEPCFARPGEGHDKGSVEARGKGIRGSHMVPLPSGPTLRQVSDELFEKVRREGATRCDRSRDNEVPAERFGRELPLMLDLPSVPFESRRRVTTSVRMTSRVHVHGAWYSVPTAWAGREVTAYVGVDTVEIRFGEETVTAPLQPFGGKHIRQLHYLPELARKPQALRQNAASLMRELGDPYPSLWRLLVDQHGPRDGARRMARVLRMIVDDGQECVTVRVRQALDDPTLDRLFLAVSPTKPPSNAVPPELAAFHIETASASRYDALLDGGGWHV